VSTNVIRQPPKITPASSHGCCCSYASGPCTVGGLLACSSLDTHHTKRSVGDYARQPFTIERVLWCVRARIIIDFAAAFHHKRPRRRSSQRGMGASGNIRMRNRRRVLRSGCCYRWCRHIKRSKATDTRRRSPHRNRCVFSNWRNSKRASSKSRRRRGGLIHMKRQWETYASSFCIQFFSLFSHLPKTVT